MKNAPRLNLLFLSGIWIALVAIGGLGRLWQPAWNVTPMAGIALAAGAVFPNMAVAASVPLAAIMLSNLVLPAYGSLAMAVIVYAAIAWPVLLGGRLQVDGRGKAGNWIALFGSALASSLVFYLTTNLAHWWLTNDYPHTAEGLLTCYAAALPFYRWMPVGDLVWSGAIFAGLSAVVSAAQTSRSTAAA